MMIKPSEEEDLDIIQHNIEMIACSVCDENKHCEDRGMICGCKVVEDMYDQGAFYTNSRDDGDFMYPECNNDIDDI